LLFLSSVRIGQVTVTEDSTLQNIVSLVNMQAPVECDPITTSVMLHVRGGVLAVLGTVLAPVMMVFLCRTDGLGFEVAIRLSFWLARWAMYVKDHHLRK
jgi:hypothetical protein